MYRNHRSRPSSSNYRGRPRNDDNEGERPTRERRQSLRRLSFLRTPTPSSSSSSEDEADEMRSSKMRRRRMSNTHGLAVRRLTRNRSQPISAKTENSSIRRSTRKRKSQFENVNDAWITEQSSRGYRRSLRRYSNSASNLTDEDEADKEEEEEEEGEDEEEEEEENEKPNQPAPPVEVRTSTRRITQRIRPRNDVLPQSIQSAINCRQNQDEDASEEESNDGSEGADNTANGLDESFPDMYARVKQRRRSCQLRKRSLDSSSTDDDAMHSTKKPRLGRDRGEQRQEDKSRKYSLRPKKSQVIPFEVRRTPLSRLRDVRSSRTRTRRRRASSTTSTSSSESGDRDRDRDHRKKRMELVGGSDKNVTKKLSADAGPVNVDQSIRFNNVGGLKRHIDSLKEMLLFPILYPELFHKFKVTPPKGVLFHGPPGTGKTLMARALANECSLGNRKVSFFMRKGADVLSKWVGESERQLRLLFQEAYEARPSIIFFDEIDGLAPVRSAKQDQIHSSMVCTLLALMDGLDNRGEIIIIGATNRINSIDPALRRPGRFDRELYFPLPDVKERREILAIHAEWAAHDLLDKMAEVTAGYAGSDLRALCTESVILSLKRTYPQIYESNKKLLLNNEKVKVERIDFEKAMRLIVPAAHRSWAALGRKLPTYLNPVLGESLATLLSYVGRVFPVAFNQCFTSDEQVSRSPRLLLLGDPKVTSLLSSSLMYELEHCPVLSIAFDTLYTEPGLSPEEVLKQVFKELPRRSGCILWFGEISLWWSNTSQTVKATFESLLDQMDPSLPILYLAKATPGDIPMQVDQLFQSRFKEIYDIPKPSKEQRENFFRPLLQVQTLKHPPKPVPKKEEMEMLMEAPPTPPPKLSQEELDALQNEEENTLRELRIFLRQICGKLARNRQFDMFSKPVDVTEVPDYLTIIKDPIDLETMMSKIDNLEYTCAQDFLNDIDLLFHNALEYNPDRNPADKHIRHSAYSLRDTAYALIKAEMDSDFEVNCRKIRDDRKKRVQPTTEEPPKKEEIDIKVETSVKMETDKEKQNITDPSLQTSKSSINNSATRKKKSNWSKGRIVKKKKCPCKPRSSGCSPKTKDSLNTSMTAEVSQCNDSQRQHSCNSIEVDGDLNESTGASEETHTELVNGCMTGATDEESDEGNCSSSRTVSINQNALDRLYSHVIDATEEWSSVDLLIDLHGCLSRVVHSYSTRWDRTDMVQELEDQLSQFC